MRLFKAISIALLCLTLPLAVLAQTGTSSVRGTVVDEKGAVVQNATITLTNPATGFTQTTSSNAEGLYQFSAIRPGTYSLTSTASGFRTEKETVILQVDVPLTTNITLHVGGTSEVVEVTGEAAKVNTTDATMGNAFNSLQIENLPFEGRRVEEILSLQPGVSYIGNNVDSYYDSRTGSVNGARSDQSNLTLDGIDNNTISGLAFTGTLRSTLDSVQEFRVTTTNGNADAGYGSGAQVAMVTKSGTNDIHGSAYFYMRPTITSANDWFNKQAQLQSGESNTPPRLDRRTFGAAVGGPIKKNKVFFFLNYEGQRTSEQSQVTRTVPSQKLKQGIIQYYSCGIGNPTNCPLSSATVVELGPANIATMDPGCTAAGTCPWGPGVNPNALAALNQFPDPNGNVAGDGLNFLSYTFAANTPQFLNTYIGKIDVNLTDRQTMFVRGNMEADDILGAPRYPGLPASTRNFNGTKGLAVGHTWAVRDNLVNSFRYGLIRSSTSTSGSSTQDVVSFRGLNNIDPGFYTTAHTIPVNNFVDDMTWVKGKHTFQWGGNLRVIHNNSITDSLSYYFGSINASWLTDSGIANTGQSLDPGAFGFAPVADDFMTDYDNPIAALTGLVTEGVANYNVLLTGNSAEYYPHGASVPRAFRSWEFEWYGQDTWHVKPNLTLTFGLRHSLLQPPFEANGQQVSPTSSVHDWFVQRGLSALQGETYRPLIQFDRSGQANGKDPYWAWDYKNFAPRFSFAWSPNFESSWLKTIFGGAGKSSIRGGYGMYFDHFGQGIVNTFNQQGSFGLTTNLMNAAGTVSPDTAPRVTDMHLVPSSIVPLAPDPSFPITPSNDPFGSGFAITYGLDDKLKTPYSHVFNFSISRELPGNFTFETAYVGRLGRRLLQQVDLGMYQNLTDPQSGMDYFTAATMLSKLGYAGTAWEDVPVIPYFENMFPSAASNVRCNGYPSVTQCIYDFYWTSNLGNETWPLYIMDVYRCWGKNGCFSYYDDQYSFLSAWQSGGTSSYHAAQFILRKRNSNGLQFDFNYTLAKSIDLGSDTERNDAYSNGGFSMIYNSWNPRTMRAVSDFDMRHQINANWVYELPFGKGKAFGAGAGTVLNMFIGGWQTTGLFRWTSGLPISISNGLGNWATNWNFTGDAMLAGTERPKTGVFIDSDGDPNLFPDGTDSKRFFRLAYPGETGSRNVIRGPGFFGIDMGLDKEIKIRENHRLKLSWQVFNVTNSVRFDVGSLSNSMASGSFGKFGATLTKPRVMQFAARYSF